MIVKMLLLLEIVGQRENRGEEEEEKEKKERKKGTSHGDGRVVGGEWNGMEWD